MFQCFSFHVSSLNLGAAAIHIDGHTFPESKVGAGGGEDGHIGSVLDERPIVQLVRRDHLGRVAVCQCDVPCIEEEKKRRGEATRRENARM